MLDAFKNITGKGKLVQKQTEELETLIATAREERTAISAMLTALTARSAKVDNGLLIRIARTVSIRVGDIEEMDEPFPFQ